MRTIIAGSRTVTDGEALERAVASCGWVPTTVLSGTAAGADRLGEAWARAHNVPLERYPADWDRFGRRAGMVRNQEMVRAAEALIALWDGQSRGTAHVIAYAREHNLRVWVEHVTNGTS